MKNHNRRRKLFVDPQLQGALMTRVFTYWLMGVVVMGLLIGFQAFVAGGNAPLMSSLKLAALYFQPTLIAGLFILPIVLIDVLKITNRFAGPMARLRREIRNLADGKDVQPVRCRDDDLCNDLTAEFNRLVERIQATSGGGKGDMEIRAYEAPDVSYDEPIAVG